MRSDSEIRKEVNRLDKELMDAVDNGNFTEANNLTEYINALTWVLNDKV